MKILNIRINIEPHTMIMRFSFNLKDRLRKRLPIDENETAIRQTTLLPLNIGEIEWPLRISKLTEPSFNLNVHVTKIWWLETKLNAASLKMKQGTQRLVKIGSNMNAR